MQTTRLPVRPRTRRLGIALGLTCGLLASTSSAMEEVTALAMMPYRAVNEQGHAAQIATYIQTVEAESKDAVKASLKRAMAPKLYVALASESSRG